MVEKTDKYQAQPAIEKRTIKHSSDNLGSKDNTPNKAPTKEMEASETPARNKNKEPTKRARMKGVKVI